MRVENQQPSQQLVLVLSLDLDFDRHEQKYHHLHPCVLIKKPSRDSDQTSGAPRSAGDACPSAEAKEGA